MEESIATVPVDMLLFAIVSELVGDVLAFALLFAVSRITCCRIPHRGRDDRTLLIVIRFLRSLS